jgi:hypothetical protein
VKPKLTVVEGTKSDSEMAILASIKPLGQEIVPSAAFLQQTRRRLLLLNNRPANRPQAA